METRLKPVVGMGAPKTFGPVYQSDCTGLQSGGSLALAGWFPVKVLTQDDTSFGGPYPGPSGTGESVTPASQEETWFKRKYASNPLAANPSGW